METNLDSLFKSNATLEESGVDFEVKPGLIFTLRRFGGKNSFRVKQASIKYYKPFARLIENGQMDPEESDEIIVKVFCSACLVGWKGVTLSNGESLEYSFENAVKLLKGLPELFDILNKQASDFSSYKEDLGNS